MTSPATVATSTPSRTMVGDATVVQRAEAESARASGIVSAAAGAPVTGITQSVQRFVSAYTVSPVTTGAPKTGAPVGTRHATFPEGMEMAKSSPEGEEARARESLTRASGATLLAGSVARVVIAP